MRTSAAAMMLFFLLTGCAHVIGNESLALVDSGLSFRMLKESPGRYSGRYVLLGGIIAGVGNSGAGGEVEVLQYDLDSRGRPDESDSSGGRFLARSPDFMDPLVFMPGLRVALVGRVEGKVLRRLDGTEYTYPLVSVREIRTLKPDRDSAYPIFHFGIGIGHTF